MRVSSLRGYLSIPSVTAANKSQTHPMPSSSEGGARRAWAAGLSVSLRLFPVLVAASRTKKAAGPFWPSESEMIKNHATHFYSLPFDSTDLKATTLLAFSKKGWAIVTHCECMQIPFCNNVSPPEIQCDQMFWNAVMKVFSPLCQRVLSRLRPMNKAALYWKPHACGWVTVTALKRITTRHSNAGCLCNAGKRPSASPPLSKNLALMTFNQRSATPMDGEQRDRLPLY